jgi:hypothetical protein
VFLEYHNYADVVETLKHDCSFGRHPQGGQLRGEQKIPHLFELTRSAASRGLQEITNMPRTRNPPTKSRKADSDALYLVDDEGILFAPASRRLYRLNTTAAFIWCCYEGGMEPLTIANALAERFGVSKELALHDTLQTISKWKAKGLLNAPIESTQHHTVGAQQGLGRRVDAAVPSASFRVHSEHHYRLLDLEWRIRYPCEELARLVHPVFAHLEMHTGSGSGRLPILFEIAKTAVGHVGLKDGKLIGECRDQAELAPMIQRDALVTAFEATPCLLAIHAAAVCKPRRCVLMPAAKGSGKSTLMAALLASGYTYLTDELSLLTLGSPRIRPVPVSLGLKRGSWPLLAPIYPFLESLPTHVQGDDIEVRYLTPPKELIASQEAYAVTHVVFPRYDAGIPTALTPLRHAEAIWRIAEGGYAVPGQLDKDRVEGLIDWIASLPCYELSVGKLEDAVHELEVLLR